MKYNSFVQSPVENPKMQWRKIKKILKRSPKPQKKDQFSNYFCTNQNQILQKPELISFN